MLLPTVQRLRQAAVAADSAQSAEVPWAGTGGPPQWGSRPDYRHERELSQRLIWSSDTTWLQLFRDYINLLRYF